MNDIRVFLRKYPFLPWAAGVAILGLLLLLSASGGASGGEVVGQSYREEYAHRIAQMADTLPGVDDVSVLITLEEEGEGVRVPRVRGIALTYRGDGGAQTRLDILNLICAALDVAADRVWVGIKGIHE
ncbi:MAG: hypothetical protein J6S41_07630 [Clostridia bacterium]|nr:hypothetical protein [Clostridia bacterium]MBO5671404.1 hypothetical protein [Clostridia bacterium]